ncbi:hypothetical protein BCR34DRAFT_575239 [Clohesyomyces aquaticus]|uniref:Uncharacterized protein n=1 Tax=Clohesyomyces aquaticus TaxID=1231657 RepID=A0A1Y1YTZ9_9PLEO|nr:hypothetical protein BCR34DRAFT_575239 [Clohesyomyces aquaticus]
MVFIIFVRVSTSTSTLPPRHQTNFFHPSTPAPVLHLFLPVLKFLTRFYPHLPSLLAESSS